MLRKIMLYVIALLLFLPLSFAGTFFVNPEHPHATDEGAGTIGKPTVTIQRALNLAHASEEASLVLITPSRYPEELRWQGTTPLEIKALSGGKVIIDGADPIGGWEQRSDGIYIRSWKYDWGTHYDKASFPPDSLTGTMKWLLAASDILQRSEVFFVNNVRLDPVLTVAELTSGTFCVDEERDLVYLKLPEGIKMDTSQVDVAMREMLFGAKKVTNLTIDGLTFTRSRADMQTGMVDITKFKNVEFRNCSFSYSSAVGMNCSTGDSLRIINCNASHNGQIGFSPYGVDGFLLKGCTVSYNNWRGWLAGTGDWSLGGMKAFRIHGGLVTGCSFFDNFTYGCWFDQHNIDISLEDSYFYDNYYAGIFLEASPGPFFLENLNVFNNAIYDFHERLTFGGINVRGANGVVMKFLKVWNNPAQIVVAGVDVMTTPYVRRGVDIPSVGPLNCEGLTIQKSLFVCGDAQILVKFNMAKDYAQKLIANLNHRGNEVFENGEWRSSLFPDK